LFHVPVIALLQAGIWRWVRPHTLIELSVWTTISTIPAILLVSVASWRWIEAPFQRLGRAARRDVAPKPTLTAT